MQRIPPASDSGGRLLRRVDRQADADEAAPLGLAVTEREGWGADPGSATQKIASVMQVIWESRASTSVTSAGAKVYANEPVPRMDAGVGEQTCVEENDEHDGDAEQTLDVRMEAVLLARAAGAVPVRVLHRTCTVLPEDRGEGPRSVPQRGQQQRSAEGRAERNDEGAPAVRLEHEKDVVQHERVGEIDAERETRQPQDRRLKALLDGHRGQGPKETKGRREHERAGIGVWPLVVADCQRCRKDRGCGRDVGR